MSEKLCLQWNGFQENLEAAFKDLREDKHFTLQNLLEKNKHPRPLIYMRGLKSEDLMTIFVWIHSIPWLIINGEIPEQKMGSYH